MTKIDLPQQFVEWHGELGWKLETTRRKLIDFLVANQFEYIHTPFIDHYGTLALGAGTLNPDNAFRFADPNSGKLLAIRTDISPQIARLDAKRSNHSLQQYCYAGEVALAQVESLNVRNPYQVGAEIFGDSSIDSDIKIINLALQAVTQLFPKASLLVDMGHSGILRLLLNSLPINQHQFADLLSILQHKSMTDLKQFCQQQSLHDQHGQLLLLLIRHHTHDLQQLDRIGDQLQKLNLSDTEKCYKYWEKLSCIIQAVQSHHKVKWHIDLANLSGIHYHTGFIFNLYSDKKLVCRGGRYDNVVQVGRPATGFTLDINQLLHH